MKKKILLYGVGTFKNRGVEAIINSTLQEIDFNKFDVSIASHDYEYNKNLYNDIKHIKHYYKSDELTEEEQEQERHFKEIMFDYHNFEKLYQKDVVKEVEKSDICISVGGDNYCYPHCTWLYTLDEYAHKLGKKTVLWGASLFEEIQEDELINDLDNFDILVIRESLSYNAVRKYVPEERIIYAPDPAFSLTPKQVPLNKWYKGRKIVAINLSPLTIQNENQEKAIYDLIDDLLKETKYSILLLPHVTTDDCNDLDILRKIKEKYQEENRVYLEEKSFNCNELKYIISKCNILVAARTHASIAAYSTEVPTLVIGYSVKSRGIAKDLFGNYDNYVISKDDLTSENLKKHFYYIEKNQKEIKNMLNEKMPSIKKQSANLFNMVLEKIEEQKKLEVCKRNSCIGCGVCMQKCPKEAITMAANAEGFLQPKIDLKKCIHCDICRQSCPINKEEHTKKDSIQKCYAAINLNKEEQEKSTSGGIFSIIAKEVLKNNGIVYGSYMKDFQAQHIRITSEKELDKIRGSKYIQSKISTILPQIKEDLIAKKEVLFCGTPCQIGAVQAYLDKEYDNLLLISVICHGVMSDNIFHKYIKELETDKAYPIEEFKFRTKENNWTQSSIKYTINENATVKPFTEDPLMQLYLKNYILRPACYNCQFKGEKNKADIILGDFWGIEVIDSDMLDQKGVSAVIINSRKGKTFLEHSKFFSKVKYKEEKLEDMVKYNPSLVKAVEKPSDIQKVLGDLKLNSVKLVVEYYINKNEQEKKMKEQEEKINGLIKENTIIATELSSIINSRRWKIMDKGINKINKLLRRK